MPLVPKRKKGGTDLVPVVKQSISKNLSGVMSGAGWQEL